MAIAAATEWAARVQNPAIDLQNESQLEQEFNRLIVQDVLGFRAPTPETPGTMRVKHPVPGGTIVDVALGHFSGHDASVLAPLELKGPTVALDRIMPGRAKTPVEQAWGYANDAPGARWVLLSNMKELRLYAVGHGRQNYETFDLRRIDDIAALSKLLLLLHADRLLDGTTEELLKRSAQADREITDRLYKDYKALRDELLQFVRDQEPGIATDKRIDLVQTLLDRLLFIAFAEDSFLLPEDSLRDAIAFHNKYDPQPKWNQLKRLFAWVDGGATEHGIPPYNGGLFATKPLLDGMTFPDALVEKFTTLSAYDFRSEVSVTILGHIFEQSISDIEALHAEARPESAPKTGKRKRHGVVYTPDFVTRFIVERTIGLHLKAASDTLLNQFGKSQADGEIKWKGGKSGERDYWTAYLTRMASLRIVDPACGSGAFLIAAFDYLHAEQRRVRERLAELDPGLLVHAQENADVDIITNNLFGVDVNAESVEITKLALWLKTAKRNRKLESLEANIQCGNSLISEPLPNQKFCDWQARFPAIFDGSATQGFDIVLGNPPYVRMELLKDIKPWLEQHYAVAADRADLYAYFFELGVRLLAEGGRLGFISSSTFFRTGSGAPLRAHLADKTHVESVVDFGDLQVFEGVTTYPAVVTLRKGGGVGDGTLTYLNARALPDDLSRVFDQQSLTMPRDRLGSGTWRFESNLLDTIRAKMALGRKTLADTYGAPLYGIKTGLNDAFVLTRAQRDAIVARDPGSADLLKPFLIGENLKRWHIESDDLWLIYTPKNQIDIDDYPGVRDHLLPSKERLERRATKQNWWELQQAQAAYASAFQQTKIIYSDIANHSTFSLDQSGSFPANTAYLVPDNNPALCAYLNSKLAWFYFVGLTNIARGGYLRLRTDFVGQVPIPSFVDDIILDRSATEASVAAEQLWKLRLSGRHRIGDIAAAARNIDAFLDWPSLTFAELQTLLTKRCKAGIHVAERDQWEGWFNDRKAEAAKLTTAIKAAEAAIDARVYALFDLNPTEIAAVEDALTLASPSLSLKAYEAISAVEGLHLSDEARARLSAEGSIAERRDRVTRAHAA